VSSDIAGLPACVSTKLDAFKTAGKSSTKVPDQSKMMLRITRTLNRPDAQPPRQTKHLYLWGAAFMPLQPRRQWQRSADESAGQTAKL
jgi:hypothetical protein